MQQQDILALITGAVREALPSVGDRKLRASDSIAEMGGDSMERAEIVVLVLERMDHDIPQVKTFGPQNLGELAEHLSAKCD